MQIRMIYFFHLPIIPVGRGLRAPVFGPFIKYTIGYCKMEPSHAADDHEDIFLLCNCVSVAMMYSPNPHSL